MVPGTRALAFAARWFDPSTVSNVFEPLIADWQREWQDASGFARLGVRIRGGSALLLSMVAASPRILLAPWPAGTLHRVLTRIAVWTTIVTTLIVAPFIVNFPRTLEGGVFLDLLVLLVPQAAAIGLPFAFTTIVDLIRTAPRPTRDERIAALRIAITACSLMLILAGWVYPATNQQFRVISWRSVNGAITGGRAAGLNEMSLIDLARDDAFRREPWTQGRAEAVARQLGRRLVLIAWPAAVIWMRWRALGLPRGRWYSAWPLPVSAPLTFLALFFVQSRGLADAFYAPRWLAPELALGIVLFGALAVDRLRRHFARVAISS